MIDQAPDRIARKEKVRQAREHLKRKNPEPRRQPFDPNNLPHRSLQADPDKRPKRSLRIPAKQATHSGLSRATIAGHAGPV